MPWLTVHHGVSHSCLNRLCCSKRWFSADWRIVCIGSQPATFVLDKHWVLQLACRYIGLCHCTVGSWKRVRLRVSVRARVRACLRVSARARARAWHRVSVRDCRPYPFSGIETFLYVQNPIRPPNEHTTWHLGNLQQAFDLQFPHGSEIKKVRHKDLDTFSLGLEDWY
jgi:hypothetical protein